MARLTFLWSIIMMCGPILLLLWHREQRILKKYELALIFMIVLSVIFVGPADYVALHWGAWRYGASVTSGIYFLTLPETYLFGIAVTLIVAAVTLVQADHTDHRLKLTRQQARIQKSHRTKTLILK